ncbi:hypothetical protein POVWA2_014530 [Plasmodium ovale wallikeri]|uniref:Uncharacterized protein n=1 Tax=Plasmodium ovale wallikeri TaxID=864142 RepID=A0A1A8YN08_PLAOA|nr:hypothetical protein POVWA1_014710 [Plasmodium ovale wallikeri]SBT33394.1 hypothetical protein POVWA2_014530 [Plasmodium ovale wallikeri]
MTFPSPAISSSGLFCPWDRRHLKTWELNKKSSINCNLISLPFLLPLWFEGGGTKLSPLRAAKLSKAQSSAVQQSAAKYRAMEFN